MHELAIVEGILEAAVPEAEKHGAQRILAINLKIGEFSGVVPACIQEYFTIAAQGTMAEGAKLVVEKIPAKISCESCGYEGKPGKKRWLCPQCGSRNFRLLSGREYFVESLEAE